MNDTYHSIYSQVQSVSQGFNILTNPDDKPAVFTGDQIQIKTFKASVNGLSSLLVSKNKDQAGFSANNNDSTTASPVVVGSTNATVFEVTQNSYAVNPYQHDESFPYPQQSN